MKVLNYGRAFFYAKSSAYNRLFIEIDSRISLTDASGTEEYHLLAPHPREQTFKDDGKIYSGMLEAEQGASFITFIVDQVNNKSVISRRYDVPGQPEHYKHAVDVSPYEGPLHNPPVEVDADDLPDFAAILAAMDAGKKIVATVEYFLHGKNVRIEFPVRVLNTNPDPNAPVGKQWQVASPVCPVYLPSNDPVGQGLRPGYIAFGRVGANVNVSIVFIANVHSPRPSQDYSVPGNQIATVRLGAIRDSADEEPEPEEPLRTIVFAGDSVTQGAFTMAPPDYLNVAEGLSDAQKFSHIIGAAKGYNNVINVGWSGDTVARLKARLAADVLFHAPAPVVIMIGINDVTAAPPTPLPEFRQDLSDIVDALQAAGSPVTLMTPNIVRTSSVGMAFPPYLDAITDIGRVKNVPVVPVYDLFARKSYSVATPAEYDALFYDDKHPSAAGHQFIASIVNSEPYSDKVPVAEGGA